MILKRFYDDKLAHASYLVGCPGAGEAVVIDANRDLDQYLAEAAKEGLRITAVTETHIHADYLSGSRELAERTGAKLYLSDEGDQDWKYAYSGNIQLVRDGDTFSVGGVKFEVMATPGHTPEHITFLAYDMPAGGHLMGAFTGDFLFVGDVGRPDLLENAAGIKGTMEPGARRLFQTIQRFNMLPDQISIWPAHGAGSACGKSLGGVPVSTLGYEKLTNWAFQIETEDEFVKEVLSGQPEPPVYFAQMKHLNKVGPDMLNGKPSVPEFTSPDTILCESCQVLDVRPSDEYLANHRFGSFHAPLKQGFTTWAGWYLKYDKDIVLVAASLADANQAAYDLSLIGLDRVIGWVRGNVVDQLPSEERASVESMTADCCVDHDCLLDVRGSTEVAEGKVDESIHVPMGYIPRNMDVIPQGKKIAVHCAGGTRSPVAIGALESLGYRNLINVSDGFAGLSECKPCTTANA